MLEININNYLFHREVVESHYMACIKEADILKHRSHIASSMQRKEHNQLWLGLQNGKVIITGYWLHIQ